MEICEAGTHISVANSAWLMYTVLALALSPQRGSDSLNGHTGGTADSDHGAAYPDNQAPGSDRRRRRRAPSDGQGDSPPLPSPPDRRRAHAAARRRRTEGKQRPGPAAGRAAPGNGQLRGGNSHRSNSAHLVYTLTQNTNLLELQEAARRSTPHK